ncbi:hypothetical protein [Streptomyces laurentii]|uniref:hypothetical protein n=1 Tax=Streptomyces laurentii TaxID=39478 RepID=UPI003697E2D8
MNDPTRIKGTLQAGTVGEDVLTVHRLTDATRTATALAGPCRRPVCGAGRADEEVTEWLRRINCRACLTGDPEM